MTERSAVFLDRDGTVIEEVGYLRDIRDLRFLPGAVEAIRLLNDAGVPVIVVTNQSGVARGYFDEEFVRLVHGQINEQLLENGAHVDGFYFCPHLPTEGIEGYRCLCECRKPGIAMVDQASRELGVDPVRSYMVGDSVKDIRMAKRAGMRSVLVLTGYGEETAGAGVAPDHVAKDLLAAVQWILAERGGK